MLFNGLENSIETALKTIWGMAETSIIVIISAKARACLASWETCRDIGYKICETSRVRPLCLILLVLLFSSSSNNQTGYSYTS